MLIITYTSSHNHPGPASGLPLHTTTDHYQTQSSKEPQTNDCDDDDDDDQPPTPKVSQHEPAEETQNEAMKTSSDEDAIASEEHFHYLQSPLRSPQNILIINQEEEDPLFSGNVNLEKISHDKLGFVLDEEPVVSCSEITTSTTKSEENDFFDELEELPIPSAFTSFMRNKFFDEGIPVVPS